jgi:hypothetical protein
MDDSLSSIRALLATTPPRWRSLLETLPASLLERPPAQAEWSAVECLRHLREADRDVFSVRLQVFLAGGNIEPVNPEDPPVDPNETPSQLLDDFASRRQQCLAVLDSLSAQDLSRTAQHAEFGPVQLGQMLNEWAAHDLVHTVQAERALAQPFVESSGPWRPHVETWLPG